MGRRQYYKPEDLIFQWVVVEPTSTELTKFNFNDTGTKSCIHMKRLTSNDPVLMAEHTGAFISEMNTLELQDTSLYFPVYQRTLGGPLPSAFKKHYNSIAPGTDLDLDTFKEVVKKFIGTYDDGQTRADALSQLRNARKPRADQYSVHDFQYRFEYINDELIPLLKGDDDILDDKNKKFHFYTAMPQAWRDDFEKSTRVYETTPVSDLLSYFKVCERLANQKAKRNQEKNRSQNHGNKKSNKNTSWAKHDKNKKANGVTSTVDANGPCPVHPHKSHKWGQCFLNPANKSDNNDKKRHASNNKYG